MKKTKEKKPMVIKFRAGLACCAARGRIFEVYKTSAGWEGCFLDYDPTLERISHVTMMGFESKAALVKEAQKCLLTVTRHLGDFKPGTIDTFLVDR